MQTIRKTTQRENCNGLTQKCSNTPDVETRTQKCKFSRFSTRCSIFDKAVTEKAQGFLLSSRNDVFLNMKHFFAIA